MNIFASIKNHFIEKYKQRKLKEEEKEKLETELRNIAYQKAVEVEKSLSAYDGYVEYNAEVDSFTGDMSFTNPSNVAETLVHDRVNTKYGNEPIVLHTIDITWPYGWFGYIEELRGEKYRGNKTRRIYYKAHKKGEICELCKS